MGSLARPPALLTATLCACLIAGSLIAGCGGGGSSHRRGTRPQGRAVPQRLDIYSSLPLSGPSAGIGRSIQRGIRLAWSGAGRRAGSFLVRYRSLNDARRGRGAWDAAQTAAGARKVAVDPSAVAYIGDFESAATEVTLPILGEAGIPQISPWSPYVGLTQSVPGVTAPGEPSRYYPSRVRNFLRIAPDDAVQTAAMLLALHDADCTRLAVLRSDGARGFGRELTMLLSLQAPRYGVRIVSRETLGSARLALRRYLLFLRTSLAGCVAYVGGESPALAPVLGSVHGEMPRAPMIASDRVCSAAAGRSAVRVALATLTGERLQCMLPAVPASTSAETRFLLAWRRAYGTRTRPGPWAAFGYTAMQLALNAVARLGSQGDDRRMVLHALFTSRHRNTVLGNFSFDAAGDVSLRSYGLYEVRAAEPLAPYRALQPSPVAADLG